MRDARGFTAGRELIPVWFISEAVKQSKDLKELVDVLVCVVLNKSVINLDSTGPEVRSAIARRIKQNWSNNRKSVSA